MPTATMNGTQRPSKKRTEDVFEKDEEEKRLEAFLFGDLVQTDLWDRTGNEMYSSESEDNNEDDQDQQEEEDTAADGEFFFDAGPAGFTMDSEPTPVNTGDAMDESSDKNEASEADETDEEDDEEEEGERWDATYGYKRAPAWHDSDDERLRISLLGSNKLKKLRKTENEDVVSGTVYERRLRSQHDKMYPRPGWAVPPSERQQRIRRGSFDSASDSDDDVDLNEEQRSDEDRLDLLKSTYGILDQRRQHRYLPPGEINLQRDLSGSKLGGRTRQAVTALQFHPNAQVLMSASSDKTLRLFQIDGQENPKIQSVFFKDLRIRNAAFHPSGDQVFVTGRRPYYYIYDVQAGAIDRCPEILGRTQDNFQSNLEAFTLSPDGRYMAVRAMNGHIIIVSTRTKRWVTDLKMSGAAVSMDWSSDGKFLHTINTEGEAYMWDVGQRDCVKRWIDDGAYGTTRIKTSPENKYMAVGSESGIVNVYDQSVYQPDLYRPKPLKQIGNLTTKITDLWYNHDSQLLAINSAVTKDAFKLVHLPSCTVYQNWPTARTPLAHVTACSFSPNSDYMVIGNHLGKTMLLRMNHYAL